MDRSEQLEFQGTTSDGDAVFEIPISNDSIKAKEAELEQLKNSFDEYVESSKDLENELEDALKDANAKIAKLEAEKASVESKLLQTQEKNVNLSRENIRLEETSRTLRAELDKFETAKRLLEMENSTLSDQIRILEASEEDLRDKMAEVEEDSIYLKTDLERERAEREEVEMQLKTELSDLRSDMASLTCGSPYGSFLTTPSPRAGVKLDSSPDFNDSSFSPLYPLPVSASHEAARGAAHARSEPFERTSADSTASAAGGIRRPISPIGFPLSNLNAQNQHSELDEHDKMQAVEADDDRLLKSVSSSGSLKTTPNDYLKSDDFLSQACNTTLGLFNYWGMSSSTDNTGSKMPSIGTGSGTSRPNRFTSPRTSPRAAPASASAMVFGSASASASALELSSNMIAKEKPTEAAKLQQGEGEGEGERGQLHTQMNVNKTLSYDDEFSYLRSEEEKGENDGDEDDDH
jgi:hypothetical protein